MFDYFKGNNLPLRHLDWQEARIFQKTFNDLKSSGYEPQSMSLKAFKQAFVFDSKNRTLIIEYSAKAKSEKPKYLNQLAYCFCKMSSFGATFRIHLGSSKISEIILLTDKFFSIFDNGNIVFLNKKLGKILDAYEVKISNDPTYWNGIEKLLMADDERRYFQNENINAIYEYYAVFKKRYPNTEPDISYQIEYEWAQSLIKKIKFLFNQNTLNEINETFAQTLSEYKEDKDTIFKNYLLLFSEFFLSANKERVSFDRRTNFIKEHSEKKNAQGYYKAVMTFTKQAGTKIELSENLRYCFRISNLVTRNLIELSELSQFGKYFPSSDGSLECQFHLLYDSSTTVDVKRFWNPGFFQFNHCFGMHEVLKVGAVPLLAEEIDGVLKNTQIPKDTEDKGKTAQQLFDEAIALKQWVIPFGAYLEIDIPPFVGVKLYEIRGDIFFVWETQDEKFFLTSLDTNNSSWPIFHLCGETNDKSEFEEFKKFLYLLMSVIIRDFWVPDRREEIFYTREKKVKNRSSEKKELTRRVIYIPRVVYSRKINLKKLNQELQLTKRAHHYVRPHLRKANPSPSQIYQANLEKIHLPPGMTFVKGHYKGSAELQSIYKSKSATILSSYFLPPKLEDELIPAWFRCEKEGAKVSEHLGYEILYRNNNPGGDGGIDLRCKKKSRASREELIISCKAWSNPVGPDKVRELIGTLEDNKNDTITLRGAIYTTSEFTSEAIKLGVRHNIQLIDGEDWAKLSNSVYH